MGEGILRGASRREEYPYISLFFWGYKWPK